MEILIDKIVKFRLSIINTLLKTNNLNQVTFKVESRLLHIYGIAFTGCTIYTTIVLPKSINIPIEFTTLSEIVDLSDIQSISDFCRAYIEIHSVLDLAKYGKDKRKLRLRIFGKEQIIQYMNKNLPAKEKKIQYIKNMVADKYVGRTCAIYSIRREHSSL